MNLISGIANSGIFAQSAYSAGNATNDGLGRNISETYLTGIPDEYATKDYVDSGLSDKYDTSSFSAISADFLIRSGLEYDADSAITGYDGSAFKNTQYSAGDNIVIDNDTISVNSFFIFFYSPGDSRILPRRRKSRRCAGAPLLDFNSRNYYP